MSRPQPPARGHLLHPAFLISEMEIKQKKGKQSVVWRLNKQGGYLQGWFPSLEAAGAPTAAGNHTRPSTGLAHEPDTLRRRGPPPRWTGPRQHASGSRAWPSFPFLWRPPWLLELRQFPETLTLHWGQRGRSPAGRAWTEPQASGVPLTAERASPNAELTGPELWRLPAATP